MKIIINIDEDMLTEEEIEACIKLAKTDFSDVTVLPERHGDLIDRDDLKLQLPTPIEDEYKAVYRIVNAAPAVIKSDTEHQG